MNSLKCLSEVYLSRFAVKLNKSQKRRWSLIDFNGIPTGQGLFYD